MIKRRRARLTFMTSLMLVVCGLASPAHAGYGWGDDDRSSSRQDSSGFWNRGAADPGRHATTAEISQALYGTSQEPYDTPKRQDAPDEEIKAG